ncbi:excalibur calcium-binding domain-containing protein [Glutamicibacter protophormiae]|nr:excalibur calcium-binding domain-containing protein [Glutamicibacter protophormiae]
MLAVPELALLLGLLLLIVSLIGLVVGKLPFLRIFGRKRIAALTAGSVLITIVAGGFMDTTGAADAPPSADAAPTTKVSETPTPSPSPSTLADFIGETCEGDELVMEQASEKLYCDEGATNALVWTSQGDHDKSVLAAKQEAEKKAAEAKAAAEKKAAEKKAVEEKAAAEKKAAEKAAADKRRAEEAAAKKEAQKQAAKEKAERAAPEAYTRPAKASSSTSYANCTAVKNAGAAPIYQGDPGYSRKLDRDGDGVGCEK